MTFRSSFPSLGENIVVCAVLLFSLHSVAFATCNSGITGTDEGAVIDNAIAACPSGCSIQIPAGTYTISTPINVCYPGIRLIGGGAGNTILVQNFNSNLITVTSNNFELTGVTLNGNRAATGYNLVLINQASYAKLHENVFTDPRTPAENTLNGVRVTGTASTAANSNQIVDNVFNNVPWIGVSLSTNANFNNIQANQFINSYTAFDFNGNSANSTGNTFSNNIVNGGSGTNFLESVTSSVITGNQFLGTGTATGYTIYMHLASGAQQSATIIGNNTFANGTGGGVYIYDNSREVVISNNYFAFNGTDGIYVTDGAGAVQNLSIQGNIFRDNGLQNATAGFAGIRLYTTTSSGNWVVSNNTAYDDNTGSQRYGFLTYGSGTAFNLTMLGNDFSRNSQAAFSFNSAVATSSIGPNRESTAGGWVWRTANGAVGAAP